MNMEEEPIQAIRETSRNVLFLNRRRQKDAETDVRRSLVNLRITQSDVTAISNKLKNKSTICASDLKILQNALVDDPKNIEVVLNAHGALRGLVRELSGHDVNKQCAACGCLCNLALGDSKACGTVAKAAGAYLVAALDTLTTQLAVSCAWTLGNLAGSGNRACELVIANGGLTKLCDVMHGSPDVQEAAVYALTHAAYILMDDLSPDHLHKIVQSLSKTELNIDSSQLLFILSCHKDFTPETLPEDYLKKIVEQLTVSIENHINICKRNEAFGILVSEQVNESVTCNSTKCCKLVYLLRVLANLNSYKVYGVLVDYFVSNNLVGNIRRLLKIDEDKSLMWLLGNIFNCCGDHVFFNQIVTDF